MKVVTIAFLLAAVLGLAIAPVRLIGQITPELGHSKQIAINELAGGHQAKLTVTSPGFSDGSDIPWQYTQYRGNRFPGLAWSKGPAGTRSYAVIDQTQGLGRADGPVAIAMTIFHIPVSVNALPSGMTTLPAGAIYGENIHGLNQSYRGPHVHTAAPSGVHFQVFALDAELNLPPATSFNAMLDAMRGHVLASGELVGHSARDPEAAPDSTLHAKPTKIESGLIQGVSGRDHSVTEYKGIPYAAPPVGDLRFQAPQPPLAWEGVRTAGEFGSSCPQNGKQEAMSEDCLTANVWTGASFRGEKRPVFVWIYGGGFSGGSGANPEFDGEEMAKKGIVVVTFNYRLGALGFLATPELSQESGHNASGNFGLLDDIALLQWVKKNIDAFGGDPDRVTIGGQSAGAGSCGFLSMSPLAKGLFERAIFESHARDPRDTELRYLSISYRTLASAEAAGQKWQSEHGASSIKELRQKPWQELLVSMAANDDSVETGSDAKPPLFRPVVDGWVVPKNYAQTMASHSQNNVAVIAGNNRDETGAIPENTFAQRRAEHSALRPGLPRVNLTVADLQSAAKRKFGKLAADFLKVYPAANDDEAAQRNNDAARDNSRVATWSWAKDWKPGTRQPVYTYFWTHRPTGSTAGAYHGSEILFVFNNLGMKADRAWVDEDRKVAATISSYWVNYIATGNPNAPGLPVWPEYNPNSPTVMELGDHFAPMPIAQPKRISLWMRFFATQPAW